LSEGGIFCGLLSGGLLSRGLLSGIPILSLTVVLYRSIFIRFAVVTSQTCEIPRKIELIAAQGHPRSSTLVPIESAYATSY